MVPRASTARWCLDCCARHLNIRLFVPHVNTSHTCRIAPSVVTERVAGRKTLDGLWLPMKVPWLPMVSVLGAIAVAGRDGKIKVELGRRCDVVGQNLISGNQKTPEAREDDAMGRWTPGVCGPR